jgi:hypothetical protein
MQNLFSAWTGTPGMLSWFFMGEISRIAPVGNEKQSQLCPLRTGWHKVDDD